MKNTYIQIYRFFFILIVSLLMSCGKGPQSGFEGHNALNFIQRQLDLGPRLPGSAASRELSILIKNELMNTKWDVEYQDFTYKDTSLRNILLRSSDGPNKIILGTHYDTRRYSDQEKTQEKRSIPVPGANDGASGTALLVELAKSIDPSDYPGLGIVLFDAEDQGRVDGWNWSVGAEYFVENLASIPDKVLIIDMVGDKDLNFYKEYNSDLEIVDSLWNIADKLGLNHIFINDYEYAIFDDHSPFMQNKIPSALLIDFDYPYWHTNDDTLDKVSKESLELVADVIKNWLDEQDMSSNQGN
jgi:glutaminyl-peptide cyclotransferase